MPDTLVLQNPKNMGNLSYIDGQGYEEDSKLYLVKPDGNTTVIDKGVVTCIDTLNNAGQSSYVRLASETEYGLVQPDNKTCVVENGILTVIDTLANVDPKNVIEGS